MPKYQIMFLSKKEMDSIHYAVPRYEHVDGENLGFADPKTNRVFVLGGLDKELTKYLINHELEHLLEEKGTHEDEHGIRHKKGGFFKNLFDPVGIFHAGNILGVGGKTGLLQGGANGGGLLGSLLNGSFGGGNVLGGSQQGGINSIFPTNSFTSSNPGFGQTGASAPSGASQFTGGAPMANVGLGAGISNQQQNPEMKQQSGYYSF